MLGREELGRIVSRVENPQPASFFESDELDFKQPARTTKETLQLLADAAVCFANAAGGTIVLGVNDRATTRAQALVGVDAGYSVDAVRRGIFDRTAPHLTANAYEWDEDDVRLMVIEVPPGIAIYAMQQSK